MTKRINIIDLFAGPGGLGEGFASFQAKNHKKGPRPFSIVTSIEAEKNAHKTLQLRSFFRQFNNNPPDEYYDYVRNPSAQAKEILFSLYHEQAQVAINETMGRPRELGDPDDDRDIEKRLRQLKKKHDGENFVVIGGPPCQAYSSSGSSRNAGIEGYTIDEDERAELYLEYLKVIKIIEPDVFVMENVKGILSTKHRGSLIIERILKDLRDPWKALGKRSKHKYNIYSLVSSPDEYDSEDAPVYKNRKKFTINFEKYGIPQKRHRVIFLGIRSDIRKIPRALIQSPTQISVDSIIDGFPKLRSGISDMSDDTDKNRTDWPDIISAIGKDLQRKLTINKEPEQAKLIKEHINLIQPKLKRGGDFVRSRNNGFKRGFKGDLVPWLYDPRLNGFPNHETRRHIKEDLGRYLWASTYAELNSNRTHPSPKSGDFPGFLAPNHKNWESGNHADRFRVQVKNKPSTTVTCHISKDGHSFIHYDPSQCRSLTVREAARLQTFPDNYFFEGGGRTPQYVQVGNAVPPYLAKQIAKIVYNLLEG